MNACILRVAVAAAAFFVSSGAAFAHTGHADANSFLHGFMHPAGGLDHVLAMVAVGLYAVVLGGRALWLVPATFAAVMTMGGAIGAAGYTLTHVEIGIALSVVVLGLAVALRISVPTAAAMALVGVFAIFHGHAHGAEMPPGASGIAYALGFMLATALLHCAGIAFGLLTEKTLGRWRAAQATGGAMALAGIGILAGIL